MEHSGLYGNVARVDATSSLAPSRIRAWGVALIALASISVAFACAGVGPRGRPVVFGDQTNIVIWDEAHHTEHFIRNANFRSSASDFGFIAPTPGKPQLMQASDQAFYTLASLSPIPPRGAFGYGFGGGGASREGSVKVIQEADVAGYHATTLWSRDAHAINDWMNDHGYVSTPAVEKWAERYTRKGWFLTAFKVLDETNLAASTGTVRMSFTTRKPFNPFYVPGSNIQMNRQGTLRVYFVSAGDYDAHIGKTELWETPQWTAAIPWDKSDELAKQVNLPAEAIPDRAQVETFVDNDFPRSAEDDIYFTKRKSVARSTAREPGVHSAPFAITLGGLGLLAVLGRRKK
jgi:hypothetical protein